MKAAVLHEFKVPLVLEDVARPTINPNEVLIEVEACGVCHSDLHVADGDWTQLAGIVKLPLILGHEIVGRVAERGAEVRHLQVGERVGVPWVHWTCGECEPCREGNENLCTKQQITGVTVDGGFAEFAKAPASHAAKIPESLGAEAAVPLLCAGVTVFRALSQVKIARGQRLAVFGVGGLGHLAVQIGRAMEAEVTAVDVAEEKLELAKKVGASATLNAATDDVVKTLRGAGGVHVAMVTSAAKSAYDMAFYCVRPTGTLLAVGLPAENVCFPPILMAAAEVRIRASAVGTRRDLKDVLEMAARGELRSETHMHPLDRVNELFDDLRRGKISGRAVIAPH